MDFRNEQGSLALASKRIIETLFGTSNGRRRRSVREEPIVSKTNETNFSVEGHECHLSKEANIIFSDIVESMDFSIKSKREIDQAVFAGNRRIEELDYYNNNDGNTSYSDMRQFLKDAQLNTSGATSFISGSNDEIILCGQKPTIKKNYPAKVVTLLGGDIDFVCEVESTLEVEYMWTKNGELLEGENGTILELRSVTEHSEGAYKCHASNTRGSTVSNVTILVVHQKPHITEHPFDNQKLVGDESVWMVCNSTGVPRPSTEWFFTPMKGVGQYAVRINVTGPVLEIGNPTTENAGFYYCNVSNLHGAVQSRIARLDISRFIPGVPRISLSVKLKQCISTPSVVKSSLDNCKGNKIDKFQQIDTMGYRHITQKMLEQMSWPVKKTHDEYYTPFPAAVISFVLQGEDPITPEGKKLEALNKFSLSRIRIGNSIERLYASLKD